MTDNIKKRRGSEEKDSTVKVTKVYHCSICGAEATVINEGLGKMQMICCKQSMKRKHSS